MNIDSERSAKLGNWMSKIESPEHISNLPAQVSESSHSSLEDSQKLRWLNLQAQETALLIIPLKMKTGSASRMVSNTSVFGVTRAPMEI